MKPEQVSQGDISDYVNVNLPRLKRVVERELQYREDQEQILAGSISVEDVVNEAIANALSEAYEKPERMKLEPWIHRLACSRPSITSPPTATTKAAFRWSVHTANKMFVAPTKRSLQFHQPDEKLFEESVIADPTANNPEELAARRELISMVEATLRDAGRAEREAFIFYTIEGFTLDEIADITNHTEEEVRAAIRKAREHLQRALPMKDPLKDRLVEYSRSA